MFDNLIQECEAIQSAWGYGLLEAIGYIQENQSEYSDEIIRELRQFIRIGMEMFSEA